MKNSRKCSNISAKKYQKRPMFGVRSGTDSLEKGNTHVSVVGEEQFYIATYRQFLQFTNTHLHESID